MTQETYIPSEDGIRRGYASYTTLNGVHAGSVVARHFLTEGKGMEFDRWLAAHDAQIRAEAWDEGHRTAIDDLNNPDCFSGTPNPYQVNNVEMILKGMGFGILTAALGQVDAHRRYAAVEIVDALPLSDSKEES